MKRTVVLGLVTALALATGGVAGAASRDDKDPKAAVVAKVEAALGKAAWDKARYLIFQFAGNRVHTWDKQTGRHRVEGKNRDGKAYVVLSNVGDKGASGQAWFDGAPAEGEKLEELRELGYGTWINDTYWLLFAFKLQDPGVTLTLETPEEVDGVRADKLKLTFENVGLTPGDTYWLHVHPETGMPLRWSYVLQGQNPPPVVWNWKGWQEVGGVKFSTERVRDDGSRTLPLGQVALPAEVPDTVFTVP